MKKFLLAFAAALVLCVPAFADSSYFAEVPVRLYNSSSNRPDYSITSDDPVFVYGVVVSGNARYFAISESSSYSYTVSGVNDYGNTHNETNQTSQFTIGDYHTRVIVNIGKSNAASIPNIAVFPEGTSDSYIASAFSEYLSSINPTPSVASSFTLPRGNVLYFKVASEQDVHFTSYMDTLSNIINFNSATFGAWGDTGQRYGEAAALPTAGTVFPLVSQSPIAWQKDSSTNILGQTKVGLATKHCIVGQWYCFYNPNANHVEGADPYNASPGASVVVQGDFSQIKVYPVNQKLSVVDGDLYSGSNDDFDSYYDGTVDQDGTVTWTNQDGNIEAPAAGGQNFEDGPKSATSLLEGIRVTLETVVHELQTLFTFGYSAIQSLVGIMSDFVSVFSGLYTWLPAEVYSALMSAVVVAIVIGVFKVFL